MNTIESRTIDGRVFLAADDLAAALRERAGEYEGGPEPDDDTVSIADMLRAVADELRARADAIDCAVIEHISG